MRLTYIILALVFCSTFVWGALPEDIKECMQRGYIFESKYCIFPDGSKCLNEEFNKEICGQEFMTKDYCIKEGVLVWDEEKCCEGLMSYLDGRFGQPKCEQITLTRQINSFVKQYMIIEIALTILLIGILTVIIWFFSWIIKKLRK